MTRIFISYSDKDRPFVTKLVADLLLMGVEVWFDKKDIDLGENWIASIDKGLEQCSMMIILANR